ncbi:MAG: thioesterase II family protein [Nostoc sp. ChiSLP01]|nr:alpha/beta fold hydrolase [Nostoc sp. CmiSLP01]MDZ8286530.1 alpha/beta fold hydrolase [Nostoc sp. ChiSLP01]
MSICLTEPVSPKPKTRLFCFHYAGGGASCFRGWSESLQEHDVAVYSVQLPGRETRYGEPRITDFNTLIQHLYGELKQYFHQPYAFYGHSLGALIAYELAYECHKANINLPLILFLGAHRAPHIEYPHNSCKTMNQQEFKSFVNRFGGIPESMLNDEAWMKVLLPLIRDDFLLCESYQPRPIEALPCPIYAFGGICDRMVSQEDINAWQQHTTKEFRSYFFPEGHFYIKNKNQVSKLHNIMRSGITYNNPKHRNEALAYAI